MKESSSSYVNETSQENFKLFIAQIDHDSRYVPLLNKYQEAQDSGDIELFVDEAYTSLKDY